MTEPTTKIFVVEYKGTDVVYDVVNERFKATPVGARKERVARSLNEMRGAIDQFLHKAAEGRRKKFEMAVTLIDDAGFMRQASYLGTRGRDTKTHSTGHAFRWNDVEDGSTLEKFFTWTNYATRKLCVVSLKSTEAQRQEYREALVALAKAEERLREAQLAISSMVSLPGVPWSPDIEDLNNTQEEAAAVLKKATSGDRT